MKKLIAAMLITIASTSVPQAQQVSIKYKDNVKTIHFDGYIEDKSDVKLERVIKAHPDVEWVTFNSKGGDLAAGNRINILMDEYLMSAAVLTNHKCASACAIGFIGAERLSLEGKLQFHSWHFESYEGNGRIRLDKKVLREDTYDAQATTSLQMYYILRSGFTWDLHYDYTSKGGDFLTLYNNKQLQEYYIGNTKFSNKFQNAGTKTFVKFSKIANQQTGKVVDKKHNVIKLSSECLKSNTKHYGRVKFRTATVKTFYQKEAGKGRTKRIKVDNNETWAIGNFKNGYVFLHTARAKQSTYGWVKVNQLEKVCH